MAVPSTDFSDISADEIAERTKSSTHREPKLEEQGGHEDAATTLRAHHEGLMNMLDLWNERQQQLLENLVGDKPPISHGYPRTAKQPLHSEASERGRGLDRNWTSEGMQMTARASSGMQNLTSETWRPSVRLAPSDPVMVSTTDKISNFMGMRAAIGPRRLQGFVESPCFLLTSGVLILLNACLVGAETNHLADHGMSSRTLFLIQSSINAYFFLELLLRLCAYGLRRFFISSKDAGWNVFDAVLVATSVFDVVTDSSELGSVAAVRVVRSFRLMRVGKVLRVLRMMRYVHEFRKIFLLLGASMQTLVWSVLAITLVLYIVAVLFTQSANDYLQNLPVEWTARNHALRSDFRNVQTSFLTLYTAISGGGTDGRNWGTFFQELSDIDALNGALYLVFITFSFFGMLNIVTSVFVECAMASTQRLRDLLVADKKSMESGHLKHMRNIFHEMDRDGSNSLSCEELREALADNPALQDYFLALELNATDTQLLFQLLDEDNSGQLDIDEFCDGCMRLKGEARAFDINCLIRECRKSSKTLTKFIRQSNVDTRRMDDKLKRLAERVADLQFRLSLVPVFSSDRMPSQACPEQAWESSAWTHTDEQVMLPSR